MPQLKILIATPTYNGDVRMEYVQSLLALLSALSDQAACRWVPVAHTFITQARNAYATMVLDGDFTHLLFLDADIAFQPSAVTRMIALDKPLIGCVYPSRQLDIGRFHGAAARYDQPEDAFSASMRYAISASGQVDVVNGVAKVDGIPTGLMLIKREVLEQLRTAYPHLDCSTEGSSYIGQKRVFQCFERLPNEHGVPVGEDFSFCKLWTDIGGEVWAVVDEPIAHIGPFAYKGRLAFPGRIEA